MSEEADHVPISQEEQDPPEATTSKESFEETDHPVGKIDDAEENKIEEEDTVAAGEAERNVDAIKVNEKSQSQKREI